MIRWLDISSYLKKSNMDKQEAEFQEEVSKLVKEKATIIGPTEETLRLFGDVLEELSKE